MSPAELKKLSTSKLFEALSDFASGGRHKLGSGDGIDPNKILAELETRKLNPEERGKVGTYKIHIARRKEQLAEIRKVLTKDLLRQLEARVQVKIPAPPYSVYEIKQELDRRCTDGKEGEKPTDAQMRSAERLITFDDRETRYQEGAREFDY